MKKTLAVLVLVLACTGLKAYADDIFSSHGVLYDNSRVPGFMYVNDNVKPIKEGQATCKRYCMLFATDKCGIKDAMDNGSITKINSIDKEFLNYALIYQKTTLRVYGE